LQQRDDSSSEDDHVKNLMVVRAQSASPLSGRGKTLAKIFVQTSSPLGASEGEEELDGTEVEGSDIARAESDDPDEWFPVPSRPLSTTTNVRSGPLPHLQQAPSPIFKNDVKAGRAQVRPSNKKMSVSELAQDLGALDLAGEKAPRRATRSTRQSTRVSAAEDDEDPIIVVQGVKGGEGQKKKKR
jgi:hypothetical protein